MTCHIVFFSSWGPGNFATVVDFCELHAEWRVSLLVSDQSDTPSTRMAVQKGIPVMVNEISGRFDISCTSSRQLRETALEPIVAVLDRLERKEGQIDLIVLAFRKILCGEILHRYGARMINVHPADLSVFDPVSRKPLYVGIGGLASSIADGNRTTRTSVHSVTENVDEGPLICLGPEVEFRGEPLNTHDIAAHEQLQKHQSDRPCLTRALELCCGYDKTIPPIIM